MINTTQWNEDRIRAIEELRLDSLKIDMGPWAIPGLPGHYISPDGRVTDANEKKLRFISTSIPGDYQVCINDTHFFVRDLLGFAFFEAREGYRTYWKQGSDKRRRDVRAVVVMNGKRTAKPNVLGTMVLGEIAEAAGRWATGMQERRLQRRAALAGMTSQRNTERRATIVAIRAAWTSAQWRFAIDDAILKRNTARQKRKNRADLRTGYVSKTIPFSQIPVVTFSDLIQLHIDCCTKGETWKSAAPPSQAYSRLQVIGATGVGGIQLTSMCTVSRVPESDSPLARLRTSKTLMDPDLLIAYRELQAIHKAKMRKRREARMAAKET
jgi:hypothetical protein